MNLERDCSVLIVDDDDDTCENLRQILELDGYLVTIANSASFARDARPWSDFFAVILDCRLPDGSADELLPEIKAESPDTAVIIITGFADIEGSIKAVRNRAEDFFLKPLDVDILRDSLAQIMRARLAEKRAADAERLALIGQMMAGIAHESRNAIQRIQNGVDILRLDISDSELVSEIAKIENANTDLKSMLEDIRDFAAPIVLHRKTIELSLVWRQAWDNLLCVGNCENAKLDEKLNGCDVRVAVDAFRFQQAFRNIFENAFAACAACEIDPIIQIDCSVIELPQRALATLGNNAGAALRIAIRDNGPGFENAHAAKILEPFFTTKQKGTGLGMSIVKRTIEAHGGSVTVGNRQFRGAEVVVTLPCE